MSDLVIVESPAKAKTIKKYLGSGYEVVASMGHVRDLPKARLSVDIKNDFAPKYDIIKGKEKLVKELKGLAANSDRGVSTTTASVMSGFIRSMKTSVPAMVSAPEKSGVAPSSRPSEKRSISADMRLTVSPVGWASR